MSDPRAKATVTDERQTELFENLHAALNAIAKEGAVIGYSMKIQFLDKCRLELSYKNPKFAKKAKP